MAIIFGTYGSSTYQPYVEVTVNSQNIAGNYSNITCTFGMYKAKYNSSSYDNETQTYSYNINGSTGTRAVTYDFRSRGVGTYNALFSVGATIIHDNDGNKTISVSGYHPSPGTTLNPGSLSGSVAMPRIPRATSPSVSPARCNVGERITITANPADSSFTHKFTWNFEGQSATFTSKTLDIVERFAELMPGKKEGACRLDCATYSGSSLIGTASTSFTIVVPNTYAPTVQSDTQITPILGGYGLKGLSSLKVSASGVPKAAASIKSFTYEIGELKPEVRSIPSGTTDEYTLLLETAGEIPVNVYATDSRGFVSAPSASRVQVRDYGRPSFTAMEVFRVRDKTSRALKISVKADLYCTDIGNTYTYEVVCRRKKTGNEQTIGTGTFAAGGIQEITIAATPDYPFADEESYNVKLIITDMYESSSEMSSYLPTEIVTADYRKNGIAFGKYAEDEELLDCAWNFKAKSISTVQPLFSNLNEGDLTSLRDLIYPIGAIYMSASEVNPATFIGGTWQAYATGRTIIGAGTGKDTAGRSMTFNAGAASGEYYHTLSTAEMPSHNHTVVVGSAPLFYKNTNASTSNGEACVSVTPNYSPIMAQSNGGSGAHNNLPPYIICYIWKRTA